MRPTIFRPTALRPTLVALAIASSACGGSATTGPRIGTPTQQTGELAAQLGAAFTLRPGETANVGSTPLRVTFLAVTNESRCPSGVQCVWEGDATIALKVSSGASDVTVALHTNPHAPGVTDVVVEGYAITLQELTPYPVEGRQTNAADYRAKLLVARR